MARKQNPDAMPVDRILKLIDTKVTAQGKHLLAAEDLTGEITNLAIAARKHGVSAAELTKHIKRMDKNTRKMVPMTRQAIDLRLGVAEGRREPRTTRASRQPKPAGQVDASALA